MEAMTARAQTLLMFALILAMNKLTVLAQEIHATFYANNKHEQSKTQHKKLQVLDKLGDVAHIS